MFHDVKTYTGLITEAGNLFNVDRLFVLHWECLDLHSLVGVIISKLIMASGVLVAVMIDRYGVTRCSFKLPVMFDVPSFCCKFFLLLLSLNLT